MTARGPTVTTPLAGDDGTSAPVPVLIGGRREMMYRCTAPNCPKAYRQASDLRTHNQLRHPTANSALSASSNAVNGNNNNNINNNNISNSASTLLSASAADAIVVGSPTGSPLLGNAHAHASSLSNSGGGVGAVGPGAMDEIRAWLSSPRVALPQIAIAQLTALLEVRKKFRLVDLRGW
jgi:hypothetical protein